MIVLAGIGRSPSDTFVNELKMNAEPFNTYFSNVGLTLANSMADSSVSFEQFVKPTQSKMLRFKLVPYSKVLNLLNSQSKSKATGLDKISGKILKAAACSIASSLTYIFNHALISCHFPSEWKVARLLPLFKKGPRNFAENYRPISILPSISKIMERIMYDQLYGISGNALSMIKSYLTDCKQKCQLGDVITSESRATCGIPQGSILGPLLFLFYINDLPDCLRQVSPRLFADDTNLTAAGETIEEVELAMNNDLVLTSVMTVLNKSNIVEFLALKLTKIYPGINTLKM